MDWQSEKVTSPVVILGEGRDEAELLSVLARHLGLQVQCIDCGGSQQFQVRLKVVVKAPGFRQVRSLGVVRDAEANAAGAADSIRNCLRAEGLAVPKGPLQRESADDGPDTAFLVVPLGETSGMMEDLILRTFEDQPSWRCQLAFFQCLKDRQIDVAGDNKKRRVQAGLASLTSRHVARNIGDAAHMGLIPPDHQSLSELRDFLQLVAR